MGRVLLADLSLPSLTNFIDNCLIEQYTEHTLVEKTALVEEIAKVKMQGYSLVEQELEIGLHTN